jgi:uncharacterized protein (TIGR02266 family)
MVDYSKIPRDSRRVPLATTVQFKFDLFSGFISEYSANISPTGMYIVSSAPEPPGRVLDLEFRLGDGFEIIKGKGEVVWSRSVDDGPERPAGMGIRFTELSEGSRDLIYRIVDRYVQEGGTPFDLSTSRDRTPVPALPDLPPLDLEPDPFPDLDTDPVKDSSGMALPWFSAAPADADPADPAELFPSIGPALEEVEKTFAGQRALFAAEPPPAPLLFPSAVPAPALRAEDPFPALAPQTGMDLFAPLDLPPMPAPPETPGEPVPEPQALSAPLPSPPPPAAPAAPDLFGSYLPKAPPAPEAPPPRTLASLAGSAAAHEEPRRVLPWVLAALLVALLAAGFLLRDRVAGWLGGGGGEVAQAPAQPLPRRAGPPPPPAVADPGGALTSDLAASTGPETPDTPETPESTPPLPEVVQRKPPAAPASAPAPAGPPVTAVERITYEESFGGTDIVVWGNGAMVTGSYTSSQMGSPPRALIRFVGMRRPFTPERIAVDTGEVRQVRVGYHAKPGGNELHVVIDLAAPDVKVTRVDQDGQRLRIHLQKG